MRRNLESTYGFAQASHNEILQVKASIARIESTIETLSKQVETATFMTVMQGCDLSEFFPVETNNQLEAFMDRNHPDWNSRKNAFFNFLLTIVTNNKKAFARGMIKAMFSREYILTVKWPSSG